MKKVIVLTIISRRAIIDYRILPATDNIMSYLMTHSRRKSRAGLITDLRSYYNRGESDPVMSNALDVSYITVGPDTQKLFKLKAQHLYPYSRAGVLNNEFIIDGETGETYSIDTEFIALELNDMREQFFRFAPMVTKEKVVEYILSTRPKLDVRNYTNNGLTAVIHSERPDFSWRVISSAILELSAI